MFARLHLLAVVAGIGLFIAMTTSAGAASPDWSVVDQTGRDYVAEATWVTGVANGLPGGGVNAARARIVCPHAADPRCTFRTGGQPILDLTGSTIFHRVMLSTPSGARVTAGRLQSEGGHPIPPEHRDWYEHFSCFKPNPLLPQICHNTGLIESKVPGQYSVEVRNSGTCQGNTNQGPYSCSAPCVQTTFEMSPGSYLNLGCSSWTEQSAFTKVQIGTHVHTGFDLAPDDVFSGNQFVDYSMLETKTSAASSWQILHLGGAQSTVIPPLFLLPAGPTTPNAFTVFTP